LPWAYVGSSHSTNGNADWIAAATDSRLPNGRYSDSATSSAGRMGPRIRRMTASQLMGGLAKDNGPAQPQGPRRWKVTSMQEQQAFPPRPRELCHLTRKALSGLSKKKLRFPFSVPFFFRGGFRS